MRQAASDRRQIRGRIEIRFYPESLKIQKEGGIYLESRNHSYVHVRAIFKKRRNMFEIYSKYEVHTLNMISTNVRLNL